MGTLAERCAAGDPDAWAELVRTYGPYLAGAIRRALKRLGAPDDPALTQDILQDTFLSLLRGERATLRRYQPGRPLERYLAAAAVARCVDWLRAQKRTWALLEDAARERLAQALKEAAPPEDPAAPAETGEARRRLEEALGRLPRRERLALQLFYWDGLPADQIAPLLKIGKESVWPFLARARQALRDLLRAPPAQFPRNSR